MATANFEPKAGKKETPRVVPLMSMDVDSDQLDKSAAFVLNPAAQPLDLIHWCSYEAARLQECAEAGIAAQDHYAEDALQPWLHALKCCGAYWLTCGIQSSNRSNHKQTRNAMRYNAI